DFMHRTLQDDVVVEQFLEGRELTVAILGNERLEVLPVWEMWFENMPLRNEEIATSRVKWDVEYAEKVGFKSGPARDLSPELQKQAQDIARRTYRALHLSGYARIDMRMGSDGRLYVIDANVNPDLTGNEDFATSAAHV